MFPLFTPFTQCDLSDHTSTHPPPINMREKRFMSECNIYLFGILSAANNSSVPYLWRLYGDIES
jgi:hypothetical protein